jgi:DEAD/DEAH box helicase domain-containing protein
MLFLDIETQNDWTSGDAFKIDEMKISYVGVIDSENGKEMDFWEDDIEELGELLKKADLIVHYNGFTFDMPVIANYIGREVMDLPQLDLMVAAHRKIGFRPKLDDLTNATLGYGKIGKGSDAVKYWVSGDLVSLKKYCLQDVKVTMDLYYYGLEYGSIKYFDRSGFIRETEIDWKDGERNTEAVEEDAGAISMF